MTATNEDLVRQWKEQPAPLLGLLHAFYERDGFLSDEVLRATASGLRIPLADLFGTVTFYHHFPRQPGGRKAPRVCTGPICCLQGGGEMLAALESEGATAMPCAGRCDDAVVVIDGETVRTGRTVAELKETVSPKPAPNPGNIEECVFAHVRDAERNTLAGYRRTGGYEGLTRAVEKLGPAGLLREIADSKLAGRGGAGFPTGLKWKAVAEAPGAPKAIVCNADEGEPGCFKDRALLDHDPHSVIEGMVLAAFATGATRGFIYLRYEYPETERILHRAIAEAQTAGLLGEKILGTRSPGARSPGAGGLDGGDFSFELHVRRGAGAYICGEEGSLLNSLEGKHPFPRNRPPFPVTHGFEDLPTVVNNVETLSAAAQIARHGAKWYHSLGLGEHAGTKLISLSGDIARPGNYEVPLGLPLQTLLMEWAGGPLKGRTIQAVTMAGLSGGFLAGDDLDVTLDEASIRSKGSFLGAGGIMVFADSRDMVAVARGAMEFFAEESCGKCFPCRIGTHRLTERLAGTAGPSDLQSWQQEVHDIGRVMMATSACGLGIAAPLVTESLLKYFPDQVARHVGSDVG